MSVKKVKCGHDAAIVGIGSFKHPYLVAKSRGAEFIFLKPILPK